MCPISRIFRIFILAALLNIYSVVVNAQMTDEEITAVMIPNVVSFLSKKVQPDGLCLYSEENFKGDRICFDEVQVNLPAEWVNKASSIGLSFAYRAIIFEQMDSTGQSQNLSADTPTLGSLNDLVSSVRIEFDDNDNDGVHFFDDLCTDTPTGEQVNVNGCSLSQLDTDQDGVTDNLDICANSPVGEIADSNGCTPTQRDTDSDGVNDALDICVDTPQGETVDGVGCSANQLSDDDADGVANYLDQCAGTTAEQIPEIDSFGCHRDQRDADGDGLADYLDAYPLQASDGMCPAN